MRRRDPGWDRMGWALRSCHCWLRFPFHFEFIFRLQHVSRTAQVSFSWVPKFPELPGLNSQFPLVIVIFQVFLTEGKVFRFGIGRPGYDRSE